MILIFNKAANFFSRISVIDLDSMQNCNVYDAAFRVEVVFVDGRKVFENNKV